MVVTGVFTPTRMADRLAKVSARAAFYIRSARLLCEDARSEAGVLVDNTFEWLAGLRRGQVADETVDIATRPQL